ncbi:hypothetical protein COCCADRAFT_87651, partial [Bipolaris zeicola 26-R-13]
LGYARYVLRCGLDEAGSWSQGPHCRCHCERCARSRIWDFFFLFCIPKSAVEVRNGGDVVACESKRRSRSWIQKSRVESSRW